MKRLLLLLLCYLPLNVLAQKNLWTEEAIKEYTKTIDADQTLTKVVCNHAEFKDAITDGVETLYAYYEDGVLVKIRHYQTISPATEIFYILHFKNNQVVSCRYVTQNKKYNETSESFEDKWIVDKDINMYYVNKKTIELTAKGDNNISLKALQMQMNNKLVEYKNMLRKK
jgi:hypothetical protein